MSHDSEQALVTSIRARLAARERDLATEICGYPYPTEQHLSMARDTYAYKAGLLSIAIARLHMEAIAALPGRWGWFRRWWLRRHVPPIPRGYSR